MQRRPDSSNTLICVVLVIGFGCLFLPVRLVAAQEERIIPLTAETVLANLTTFMLSTNATMASLWANDTAFYAAISALNGRLASVNSSLGAAISQNAALLSAIAALRFSDTAIISRTESVIASFDTIVHLTSNITLARASLAALLTNDQLFLSLLASLSSDIAILNSSILLLNDSLYTWQSDHASTVAALDTQVKTVNSSLWNSLQTLNSLIPTIDTHTREIDALKKRATILESAVVDLNRNITALKDYLVNVRLSNNETADFLFMRDQLLLLAATASQMAGNLSLANSTVYAEFRVREAQVTSLNATLSWLFEQHSDLEQVFSSANEVLSNANKTLLNEFAGLDWNSLLHQNVSQVLHEYPKLYVFIPSKSEEIANMKGTLAFLEQRLRSFIFVILFGVFITIGFLFRELAMTPPGEMYTVTCRVLVNAGTGLATSAVLGFPIASGLWSFLSRPPVSLHPDPSDLLNSIVNGILSENVYLVCSVFSMFTLQCVFVSTVSFSGRTRPLVYVICNLTQCVVVVPVLIRFFWPYITSLNSLNTLGFTSVSSKEHVWSSNWNFTDFGGALICHCCSSVFAVVGLFFVGPRHEARRAAFADENILLSGSSSLSGAAASNGVSVNFLRSAVFLNRIGLLFQFFALVFILYIVSSLHGVEFQVRCVVNSVIAACSAFLISSGDFESLLSGAIAVSASAHIIRPPIAFAVGCVAAAASRFVTRTFRRQFVHLDDVANVVGVHLVPSLISLLSVIPFTFDRAVSHIVLCCSAIVGASIIAVCVFKLMSIVLPTLRSSTKLGEQVEDVSLIRKLNFVENHLFVRSSTSENNTVVARNEQQRAANVVHLLKDAGDKSDVVYEKELASLSKSRDERQSFRSAPAPPHPFLRSSTLPALDKG
eukprot:ANDGO_00380.mRNA.1 hypothetical protein